MSGSRPSLSRRLQRKSISTATTPSPAASPVQMPTPRQPVEKASAHADAEADRPIADQGEDHRHARVVEPAQHARADDLRAVDDLEQGRDRQEGDAERDHRGVGRRVFEEQSDERVRER